MKSNVICGWCKVELPPKPGLPPGKVSHGICQPCADRWLRIPTRDISMAKTIAHVVDRQEVA